MFLSGSSRYYSDNLKYQIRAVKGNKEIDRIEFSAVEAPADHYGFDVFRNEEIHDGIYIISASFINAHCGAQLNKTTLFFDTGKLYHIETFSNSDFKTLEFENGKIQLYNRPFVDDSSYELEGGYYRKEMIEEYIWDGRKLHKI